MACKHQAALLEVASGDDCCGLETCGPQQIAGSAAAPYSMSSVASCYIQDDVHVTFEQASRSLAAQVQCSPMMPLLGLAHTSLIKKQN